MTRRVALLALALCMAAHAQVVPMNPWNDADFITGHIPTTQESAWKAAPASLAFNPVTGPPVVPVFNQNRSGLTISSGNSSLLADGNTYGHGTVCTGPGFGGGPDTTNPLWTHHNTTTTINTTAGCSSNLLFVVGTNLSMQHGMSFFDNGGAIQSRANSRVFIGLTDQTAATMTGSANPAGNYIGLRVESGTDSNYRCVMKDGTTQTTADSGVATANNTGVWFEVKEDVVAGKWYISINGNYISACTFSSNRPAVGTLTRWVAAIQNTAAEEKALNFWWVWTGSFQANCTDALHICGPADIPPVASTGEAWNPWKPCVGSGDVMMYDAASDNRIECQPIGILQSLRRSFSRRRHSLTVWQGVTNSTGYGHSLGLDGGIAANQADANNPVGATYTTAATINFGAGVFHNGVGWRAGKNILLIAYTGISSTADVRAWVTFSDQSYGTMVLADNPAGNYAGFRYSTDAADVNWKCITKDGTTQSVTDSGVAADTSAHNFVIVEDVAAGNYKFYIDNTLRCTKATNLPTSGTALRWVTALVTRIAATKAIFFGWIYAEHDTP